MLISHGFTGTPQSMRPWAEHLAAQGYSVRLPRLPGHGTTWQEMNRTTWTDWYAEIRAGYDELAARCDTVFACGLSMGGALVTRLAEDLADDPSSKLAGLVLVNVALRHPAQGRRAGPLRRLGGALAARASAATSRSPASTELSYDRTPLRAFVSMQAMWRLVIADLGKIRVPILYYHSAEDHVVDELSAKLLHAGATATTVREVSLANSYHVATVDHDAELIFAGSVDFIAEHTRTPVGD